MQLNLRLALISALALLPMISHAADGEIKITGTIVTNTCEITTGTPVGTHIVVLPTVSANALTPAGTTAGRTPIAINLTNCDPGSKVSLYFEPGSGTDMSTGKLKNTASSGGAENVQVGLLNADFSPIALDQPQASQYSQLVDITGGDATLTYFAEYYSVPGGVTAGAVKADTFFTLTYQ